MKTVMVFGTFDILHAGHIYLLKKAKKYGDKLIVIVGRDSNIKKIKEKKSFYNESERVNFLKELKIVDKAILGDKIDPYKKIKKMCPDTIVLGYDQKNIFVSGLKKKLVEFNLNTRIIRINPYKKNKYKSKKIMGYLQKMI